MTHFAGLPPASLQRLRDKAAEGKRLGFLSCGAGWQSTALAIVSALGLAPDVVPRYDGMIFADPGWESHLTYAHLDRLEAFAADAGIPLLRVSAGNIRDDALRTSGHYATMPLHVMGRNGARKILRRQCTEEYKIKPIMAGVRAALGAPVSEDGKIGRVPAGRHAFQDIGISADEARRMKDGEGLPGYLELFYPLVKMGLTRQDCGKILKENGFENVPPSDCIGCPFHGNQRWREIRDNRPEDFLDAVAFDHKIRNGHPAAGTELDGDAYLHRARVPLEEAPLDVVTTKEWAMRQGEIDLDVAAFEEDPPGCSPWACRRTEIPQGAAREAAA